MSDARALSARVAELEVNYATALRQLTTVIEAALLLREAVANDKNWTECWAAVAGFDRAVASYRDAQ